MWLTPPHTQTPWPAPCFLSCSFEDSDFMKQLVKPKAERQPPALQVSREDGVEVWKKFAEMPNKVHY